MVWLRSNEPEAVIETQVVPSDENEVVCRATIALRSGASVTAHGSARRADDGSAVEQSEDRALARALASLGYGAEYLEDDDIELAPVPSPPVNLMTARALMDRTEESYDVDLPPEPESGADDDPESDLDRPSLPAPMRPASSSEESPVAPEDISWTKFWAWAKPRGYASAMDLGELLNVDVLSHTPGEIRRMIKRYELEHPPSGGMQ